MEAEHDDVGHWTDCWTCCAWWQDVMRPGARHQTVDEFDREVERIHQET